MSGNSKISVKYRKNFHKFFSSIRARYSNDMGVRQLIGVIQEFQNDNSWTDSDYKAFSIINGIRADYLKSNENVEYKDFGAINPRIKRTKNQEILGLDTKRQVKDICKNASTPEIWGRLLYKLISNIKPDICLELGTNLGISAAFQLMALKNNNRGKLFTLEGASQLAGIANKSLSSLGYPEFEIIIGKFSDSLPQLFSKDLIVDIAFIDGHHDKVATKKYFEQIYPHLSANSILIFDDINWSDGMNEVWKDISADKRLKACFDMGKWGICLVDGNIKTAPKQFNIALKTRVFY